MMRKPAEHGPIPRLAVDPAYLSVQYPTERKPGAAGRRGGGLRVAAHIHVVDDDPSFLTAVERRLRHAGYEVATYATAQHLLDNLPTDNEPSCLLLDVRIPGLGGPSLQERLIELGSTLPIIFISGYTDIPITVRALKAGAHDFLTKPVASDELLRAIEKALAHQQASQGQRSTLDGIRARIAKLTPRERQVFEHHRSRHNQQTSGTRAGHIGTHHQGPSAKGDGEDAGSHVGGTCVPC